MSTKRRKKAMVITRALVTGDHSVELLVNGRAAKSGATIAAGDLIEVRVGPPSDWYANPCPLCKAAPGERCVKPSGARRAFVHKERMTTPARVTAAKSEDHR